MPHLTSYLVSLSLHLSTCLKIADSAVKKGNAWIDTLKLNACQSAMWQKKEHSESIAMKNQKLETLKNQMTVYLEMYHELAKEVKEAKKNAKLSEVI